MSNRIQRIQHAAHIRARDLRDRIERIGKPRNIFFLHIMKTAGTSMRLMLERRLREEMYPWRRDIKQNHRHQYLPNADLVERFREEDKRWPRRRVIIGHYPYVLAAEVFPKPFIATFLRDPVKRTLSIIAHRRRKSPEFADCSITEILQHRPFVEGQVLNYQTRVFAINDPMVHVNARGTTSEADCQRALERLARTGFVGLTERFEESLALFHKRTGIRFHERPRKDNVSQPLQASAEELAMIESLVEHDQRLYQAATERFERHLQATGLSS